MRGKQRKPGRSKGFTLIELLVVVIIIGILAAIALPNFIGVQDKARAASVKANMRTTQIAAETFATDNGGTYPPAPPAAGNAYGTYFPGGDSGGVKAGNPPVNPFTNAAQWSDFINIAIANVTTERSTPPAQAVMTGNAPGKVGYSGIGVAAAGVNSVSYAIEGTDAAAQSLGGSAPGTTLVLSNQ